MLSCSPRNSYQAQELRGVGRKLRLSLSGDGCEDQYKSSNGNIPRLDHCKSDDGGLFKLHVTLNWNHHPVLHRYLTMQLLKFLLASAPLATLAAGAVTKRQSSGESGFSQGQPISADGKGAPILGGTNKQVDLDNPSNLGSASTDNGVVPNLKWRFSDSHVKLSNGGWTREQVVTDLPSSRDIAAAQQHLRKGAIRELHWHRVVSPPPSPSPNPHTHTTQAEWGWVYAGRILVSAVDEEGRYTQSILNVGDVWYFPKGAAHTVQGLDDENEYLLVFDDGDFDKVGTTFMVDDWLAHTPRDVIAKNFGVDASVFKDLPTVDPYILKANVSERNVTGSDDLLTGDNAYVYFAAQHQTEPVPGEGGTFRKVDSTTFPIAKTISAAFVTLEPKGLRELHWHPNVSLP